MMSGLPSLPRLAAPLIAGCAAFFVPAAHAEEKAGIAWQPWSDGVFKRAAAEHRLVLLDLEAIWCHWCHVMDGTTYADARVARLIRDHYIAVRVDQDSRPDISNRYEDYGWPATVIFKWDAAELAKRRGYIPPRPMATMLEAFVKDPTPGPSVEPEPSPAAASGSALSAGQMAAMRKRFLNAYDPKLGGWGHIQKFLDWQALEYCLTEGEAPKARQTLAAGLKLIDPVWGGLCQYSVDGDWDHPHYEKIMSFQAENIRIFSLAASLWHEPRWLEAARKIRGYLDQFLVSPEGAFYTSQDADLNPGEESDSYYAMDDTGRRAWGIPRVDQHIYARENGLAITGLATLYAASGDAATLAEARRAAEWVVAHRALPGGGFCHDARDAGGPYLADTLEMGRAFLALYGVTAERSWLERAEHAARFIDAHFRAPAGFATSAIIPGASLRPRPEADENVALVRLAGMLARYTGRIADRAMAGHAMRYLASPTVVERQGYAVAGILMANRELNNDPAHITIVGSKDDPSARALFATALRGQPAFTRLEWLDPREGPLPNADVEYPASPTPAAYLCTGGACSPPLTTPAALERKLGSLVR